MDDKLLTIIHYSLHRVNCGVLGIIDSGTDTLAIMILD